MMKRILTGTFLLIVFLLGAEELDYAKPENWIIRQSDRSAESAKFDLVYVYPTLTASRKTALMDLQKPGLAKKTRGFAEAQTVAIFGNDARVFAPFVRQLEFFRCVKMLTAPGRPSPEPIETGIQDTMNALKYYLKNFHRPGAPYILLGHSQGAADLYEAIRRMPEVSPNDGFVAAYLPGLPRATVEDIDGDFAGRGIRPASGPADLGVIAVWQTQSATAANPVFTVPNGYVINPISWRADATPAPASDNLEMRFYNYLTGQTIVRKAFCGARVDPAKGALIVDLPADAPAGLRIGKPFGDGVYHVSDIWLFAGNLAANARDRVAAFRKKTKGTHAKGEEKTF